MVHVRRIFDGIQVKVKIVEFMSCISVNLDGSIEFSYGQVFSQGYFDNCIESVLGLTNQWVIYSCNLVTRYWSLGARDLPNHVKSLVFSRVRVIAGVNFL